MLWFSPPTHGSRDSAHAQWPRTHFQSHARTLVRECCKGDDESQWERGKFDPPPPLRKATAETRAPILTQNTSNDAVPRKEVPFGGRETKI